MKNRGGARDGAGRRTEVEGPTARRNVTLDDDTEQILKRLGDGNLSRGIRIAARRVSIASNYPQGKSMNIANSIANRIEQAPACEVINLTDAERRFYTGAGWKLARFVGGSLVEFFDPIEIEWQENMSSMANDAYKAAVEWLANTDGEIYLVMCSCWQLCEPRRITLTDASALAHMSRVFIEQFVDE